MGRDERNRSLKYVPGRKDRVDFEVEDLSWIGKLLMYSSIDQGYNSRL